jgi:glycosyltransferase involved in cell wall biosynthesis
MKIKDVVARNQFDCEIIFIDDGSSDNSGEILKAIARQDDSVMLISLRMNFGKAMALQTGFRHCTGEYVITMDADLQDDPEEIPNFINKLRKGYDIVSGYKYDRHDSLEKRLPSKLFNKITSVLSGIKLHDFNCGFKAYRQAVIRAIDIYGEMHRYIPVIAGTYGFSMTEINIRHHRRKYGKSKYGIGRYLKGLFDSLTSTFMTRYYDRPMYFFGKLGLILLVSGISICIYLTYFWFDGRDLSDRPLLLLGVLLVVLGAQSISIGFVADMLVQRTFRQNYNENHVRKIYSSKTLKTPPQDS